MKFSLGNRINKALLSLLKVNDIPDSGKILIFRRHESYSTVGNVILTSGFTFLYCYTHSSHQTESLNQSETTCLKIESLDQPVSMVIVRRKRKNIHAPRYRCQ